MLGFVVPFLGKRFNFSYSPSYTESKREYYERAIFPQNTHVFLGHEAGISAKLNIHYKDLDWGIPENMAARLCGIPRYSIKATIAGFTYYIIFHREQLENISSLVQLHFINDRFFYSCSTLKAERNFKHRSIIKANTIKNYSSIPINAAANSITLSDTENNKILITDSVYFHLGYLTGDRELLGILDDFNKLVDANSALIDNRGLDIIYG